MISVWHFDARKNSHFCTTINLLFSVSCSLAILVIDFFPSTFTSNHLMLDSHNFISKLILFQIHDCSIGRFSIRISEIALIYKQAALFFGVDSLLIKCRVWFDEVTSFRGSQSPQLCLDDLIHFWNYGLEHGKVFFFGRLVRFFIWFYGTMIKMYI